MTDNDHGRASRAEVGRLYARYSEVLLAYIRATLPIAKSDAFDVLHTVFIELLKWHDSNPGKVIEWERRFVYKVTDRHLRKYVDKCRRTVSSPHQATSPDELELGSAAREDDVEYMARLSMERRTVLRAMRRLGDPSRTSPVVTDNQRILYLRFWAGMTELEIGEVIDVPRPTLAGRLRRTIAALRVQVDEIERQEPGSTETSATLLDRWWKCLESADS